MKILVTANQKGGVGKSTLTAHLAYAAHEDGKRVLMVDMDRQGSLSMTFPSTGGHGIVASQLYLPALPADAAIEMVDEGLGIVRADAALLEVDRAENSVVKRPRAALQQFADQFDLCLIDTPPLLGMRLLASLAAADYVVTPLSIGVYELAGLGDLMQTMQALRQKGVNQHAKHIGFLPVNTNTRSTAERDGLANNMIYGILEDPRGHLWLSTNKGLSRFDPASLTFKNYDVYDGLQANEFNAGAYCLSRSGEMFFGGVNGMNSFFPDSIQANTYVPPLAITSFSIFGRPQQRLLSEAVFHKQPIRLSYDQNFISFEFSALDYTNPGKNRYAYKLEGFDENWIDCYDRRFISFTNLAPGEYVFRVKGTNSDGVWNEQGSGVAIIITPPFWKTWWFVSICTALLLLVTYAAHQSWVKSRLKRLLEIEQIRQQENERVRAKAAHDFHDELGHKITKISLFSEILKRSVSQGPPEISDYLTRIGDTAKSLSGGMRDFIWTLNPDKDSLQEVLVRLKDFGDDLFDKTGIDFRVSGITPEMEYIRLSTDWRRHLTLMFKEAMTNALKHAGCNNVTLEVAIPGNRLKITLSDDGKGLPADKLNPNGRDEGYEQNVLSKASVGNGLNNIRFRARQIGGTVSFRPAEPHGTRITFSGLLPDSE